MDMPVNVPVDDPNADTEWNDILRKHGVIPEKPPSPTPMIQEALIEAKKLAHENRLEGKDLDELDELEDEEDEDFLDQYRQKRMNELAELRTASVYNQVYTIQKPEYSKEVTEESEKAFVLVLLTSSSGTNMESQLMVEVWRELAKKYGDIKFCQIPGNLCIEGYPDRNTPTVLCYRNGEIRKQLVTLKELNGANTKLQDMEKVLIELEAVKRGDSRLQKKDEDYNRAPEGKTIRQGKLNQQDDDEDSDWD